jgi:hypothetical protein
VKPIYSSIAHEHVRENSDDGYEYSHDSRTRITSELIGQSRLETSLELAFDDYERNISKAFDKKRGIDLSRNNAMLPGISISGKRVLLPDTINKDDNLIVQAMSVIAKKLEFEVELIPYGERKIRDLTPAGEQFAAGISFVILDGERKFNINKKEDLYEAGRTYARAQQIMGAVEANTMLGLDCLKRNNRHFGNNPNEVEVVAKTRTPVRYEGKTVSAFFIEEEWAEQLRIILNSLLRRSHVFVKDTIMAESIKDNMLQYSEAVSLFAVREVVITPAIGKRPAITVKRVPKKPKANALLLKSEMTVIDELISELFAALYGTSRDEWYTAVVNVGWKAIKAKLVERSSKRSEWLSRFAAVTTKRLGEIRKLSDSTKTKRKADVTSAEVASSLSRRNDPVSSFADEIISMDPTMKNFLTKFIIKEQSTDKLAFAASRQALINYLADKSIYASLDLKNKNIVNSFNDKLDKEISSGQQVAVAAKKFTTDNDVDEVQKTLFRSIYNKGHITKPDDIGILAQAWSRETNKSSYSLLNEPEKFRTLLEAAIVAKVVGKKTTITTLMS